MLNRGLKYTVTGFGSQFSHDGQVRNRMFHFGYNFLVLVHLLVDELQTWTLRETMMEFLEMKTEANSDHVLNQFILGNICFWTVSDIVCRSTSSFPI